MARRRKSVRKPATRRRRRISGMTGSNVLMTVAGIAGGAVIARIAANMAQKTLSLDSKIVSAGQIALGIFLPKFIKSQLGKDLGSGMIAVGGMTLAQSLGVVSGMDDDLEITLAGTDQLDAVNGYGSDFGMGGTSDLSVVNGIDEMDNFDY